MKTIRRTDLDPLVRIGPLTIAAISERMIQGVARPGARRGVLRRARPAGLWLQGSKRPVAALLRRDGATTALDISGAALTLAAFDQRFPGLRAEFERRADWSERRTGADDEPWI